MTGPNTVKCGRGVQRAVVSIGYTDGSSAQLPASIVATDAQHDLAVLRVDAAPDLVQPIKVRHECVITKSHTIIVWIERHSGSGTVSFTASPVGAPHPGPAYPEEQLQSGGIVMLQLSCSHGVQMGTSRGLRVGQSVFALGNPQGLSRTLTAGVVSGLNRAIPSPVNTLTYGAIQVCKMSQRLCFRSSDTKKQVHLFTACCWSCKTISTSILSGSLSSSAGHLTCQAKCTSQHSIRIQVCHHHAEAMCGACRLMLPSMVAALAERC